MISHKQVLHDKQKAKNRVENISREHFSLHSDFAATQTHATKSVPLIDVPGYTTNFACLMQLRTRVQKRKIGDYKIFKCFACTKLLFFVVVVLLLTGWMLWRDLLQLPLKLCHVM